MNALNCEMCGSTNIIKQDGLYVCQQCGTKYSVEEAKKMMIEGTVDVKGTVQIDSSKELENLYQIARRAKDTNNSENAAKYYNMVLVKDPNSWEANFYTVYYKSMSCTIGGIYMAATSLVNCQELVLNLVKEYVQNEEEQKTVLNEIYTKSKNITDMLHGAALNHYFNLDASIKMNYIQEYIDNAFATKAIMSNLGDSILIVFGDTQYSELIAKSWKDSIALYRVVIIYLNDKKTNIEEIKKLEEKIKKYDPTYTVPEISMNDTSSGCYIATSIYGSYDCPEVWTLRRFRDYVLAETWYGRTFVEIYYTFSPTLVKWFGQKEWFKKKWRGKLNNFVAKLNKKGIDNTPYYDRN